MKDLRRLVERRSHYPAILFVFHGFISDGENFFARFWPGARAVADIDREFYEGFGLPRGGTSEVFGLPVWKRGLEALLRGHFFGKMGPDPWQLPGVFLVREDRVLWEHRSRHAGDYPDFAAEPWSSGAEPASGAEPGSGAGSASGSEPRDPEG